MWPLLVMGAMTLMKMKQDQAREEKDANLAGALSRVSPWSGIQPGSISRAKPADTLMQGLGSGLMMNQMMASPAAPGMNADLSKSVADSKATMQNFGNGIGDSLTPGAADGSVWGKLSLNKPLPTMSDKYTLFGGPSRTLAGY